MRPRPMVRDWIALILLGGALGTIFLGIGARVAMRILAVGASQAPTWTLGGTLAVVALGAANGGLGAVIRLVTAALVPGPQWLESTLFGVALAFLTARGLHPVDPLSLALFGPLVAAYAVILETLWRRRSTHARPEVAADAV